MILFTLLSVVVGIIIVGVVLTALGLLGIFGDLIVCILIICGLVSLFEWLFKKKA